MAVVVEQSVGTEAAAVNEETAEAVPTVESVAAAEKLRCCPAVRKCFCDSLFSVGEAPA